MFLRIYVGFTSDLNSLCNLSGCSHSRPSADAHAPFNSSKTPYAISAASSASSQLRRLNQLRRQRRNRLQSKKCRKPKPSRSIQTSWSCPLSQPRSRATTFRICVRKNSTFPRDGEKQEVAFFATVSAPFHVVLLLDTSASTKDKLGLSNAPLLLLSNSCQTRIE